MVRIKLQAIMIVCICHRVSDRDIAHAASAGCASFDDLQDELRVGLGCGACHDCARDTFDAHCTQHGSQVPRPRVDPVAWAGAPA
jgi:bacterioferritin-associated ferredoxin